MMSTNNILVTANGEPIILTVSRCRLRSLLHQSLIDHLLKVKDQVFAKYNEVWFAWQSGTIHLHALIKVSGRRREIDEEGNTTKSAVGQRPLGRYLTLEHHAKRYGI